MKNRIPPLPLAGSVWHIPQCILDSNDGSDLSPALIGRERGLAFWLGEPAAGRIQPLLKLPASSPGSRARSIRAGAVEQITRYSHYCCWLPGGAMPPAAAPPPATSQRRQRRRELPC
jgi:hypothetical protein|eukprot:COSAG01_NODE_2084_length_8459_cov_121.763038_1_plen_117_part_00